MLTNIFFLYILLSLKQIIRQIIRQLPLYATVAPQVEVVPEQDQVQLIKATHPLIISLHYTQILAWLPREPVVNLPTIAMLTTTL